jgi:DNA replication protein DnaC
VAYYNVQKLLIKTKMARVDGTIYKLFEQLAKTDLLVMDDFGLTHLEKQQQMDLMEIIEDRHARKATIIASQLPVSSWYNIIGEETIADAILDRLVHTSHRIELKGESLRKKM